MAEYQVGEETYEIPDDVRGERLQTVLTSLARRQRSRGGVGRAATRTLQGFNVGLADVLGAPVDLVNIAPMAANLLPGEQGVGPISDRPVGGSQHLRGLLKSVGAGYEDIQEVEPAWRPLARGGEAVGATAPFAAAPLAKGLQLGTKSAQGLTAPIVESARQAPGQFAAAEAVSAGGAGVGAGVAETVAPESTTARIYGEIAGGMTPAAVLMPLAKALTGTLRSAGTAFSPGGRKRAAASRVQSLMRESGEDIPTTRGLLTEESASGADLTAAQKAGSPTLRALDKRLISESRKLGGDIGEQTERAVRDLNAAMRRAVQSGDPAALREVAQAQRRWFEGLIDARIAQAQQKASQVAADIPPGSPEARRQANEQARNILEDALADARQMEKEVWGAVAKDQPVDPQSGLDAYAAVRSEILPEEGLPAPIERTIARWAKARGVAEEDLPAGILDDLPEEAEEITAKEVLRLRSRILAASRRAAGQGDWDLRRHLEMIADGLLDDLSQLPGADEARSFSRVLNDKFRRTFAGEILGRTSQGGKAAPPEVTLERTMRTGGPEADVRARGLEEAVAPIEGGSVRYLEAAQGRPEAMRQAQELYLRDVAGDLVDPATGRVSPERLAKFRKNNRDLLSRFPRLGAQLSNAERANRTMKDLVPQYERARKIGNQRAAFSKVAFVEDPTVAFSRALTSDAPVQSASSLFRLAAKGGAQAKAGARAAYLEAVFGQLKGPNGLPDPDALEAMMLKGPLRDAAMRSGVFQEKHLENLKPIIEEIRRFQNVMQSGRSLDEVLDSESALFDVVARVLGANLGGASGFGQSAGAPLVMAQVGSQRMRQLLNKMPRQKVTDILIEAVQNPQLMADLLEEPTNVAKANRIYSALTETMYRIGIERPLVAERHQINQR